MSKADGPHRGDERFAAHPDAIVERSGDELLLVHLGEGSTFRLNTTGRRVWESLVAGASIGELAGQLAGELGATPEALERDARALVEELLDAHLLVVRRMEAR